MVQIGNYQFTGPYWPGYGLPAMAGVYLVIDHTLGNRRVIDIGESDDIAARISTHDRTTCWHLHRRGELRVWILHEPNRQRRRAIERELRQMFRPPCGVL